MNKLDLPDFNLLIRCFLVSNQLPRLLGGSGFMKRVEGALEVE